MKTYNFLYENELVGKGPFLLLQLANLLRLHPTGFRSGRNSTSQIRAASVVDGSKNKNSILMVILMAFSRSSTCFDFS